MKRELELCRVFVGGLSYSSNWQSLKDHFTQVGEVEFASVITRPDGTSKGCGMVNYVHAQDAATAVNMLNESMLDGRHIMVKLDAGGDSKRQSGAMHMQHMPINPHVAASCRTSGRGEGVQLPPDMISRVFVGNLAFSTNWQSLKDHLKPAGDIEFASVLENPNGTSKGCGMVNFQLHEEALQAVSMFDGSMLDGRSISVKLDVNGKFRERPPAQAPRQTVEHFYTLPAEQICRVFVGNLSFATNWQSLKDHFLQAGEIEFASVLLKPDRSSKGCGMVNFKSPDEAQRAVLMLNDSSLDGRNIIVKLDVDGKFKDRPDPGSRPRVHQRPASAGLAGIGGMAAGGMASMSMPSGGVVGRDTLGVNNSHGGNVVRDVQAQLASAGAALATGGKVDVLQLLSEVAQSPAAREIDWPSLIGNVASSVQALEGR